MTENELSKIIVDCCFKIHNNLGPGLLESVYEEVLCYELTKNNLHFERQKPISIIYENVPLNIGFIADIIIEKKVIVEISSNRLGATAVMSKGSIVGIITDGDLRRMLLTNKAIDGVLAKHIMNKRPKSGNKDMMAVDGLNLMKEHNI